MGGSSKKQVVGYRYELGMHMVLCHGPIDFIYYIEGDGKLAWVGTTSGGRVNVNKEELFGGDRREGGLSGAIDISMGEPTQERNDYLQSQLGVEIPAFRTVVSAIFRQFYFGMNPYLKRISFRGQRIFLRQDGIAQWLPAYAAIESSGSFSQVFELAGTQAGSPPSAPNIVTMSGFNAADIVYVRKYTAPNALYKAWSPWGTDDPVFTNGLPWWNRLTISPSSFLPYHVWIKQFVTEAEAESYAINNPIELTGSTSYDFYLTDTPPNDNRGGMSVLVSYPAAPQLDMNPAHIIRECLTDPDWGMGYNEADIDDAAFEAAAIQLFNENMGISLLWDRQITIEEFIQIIVRHIDGAVYVDRKTGLFVLDLIRDDYTIGLLPLFDENNISKVENITRQNSEELVNSVTVKFWDPKTGKDASITIQDGALIQMHNAVINTTLQYPGFTSQELAGRIAMRDLKTLSTPLWTGSIYTNRDAEDLKIGSAFKLTWAEYGITELVMRVTAIAYGNGESNQIKIDATQSIFSIQDTSIVATPPTDDGWIPPVLTALPSPVRKVGETPYYLLVRELGQASVDGIILNEPDAGYLYATGTRPASELTTNYNLYTNPGAGYLEEDSGDFSPYCALAGAINESETILNYSDAQDLDLVVIGSFFQIDDELIRIDAIGSDTLVVGRGILDTLPTKHLAGSDIVFIDAYLSSDEAEYIASDMIDIKLVTSSGAGDLPIDLTPVDTATMDSRAIRPYPPGKFLINDIPFGNTMGPADNLNTKWAHRDRLQQTSAVYSDQNQGDIGPEAETTYTLRIYGEEDALGRTVSGLTGVEYDYPTALEELDFNIPTEDAESVGDATIDLLFSSVGLLLKFVGANSITEVNDYSKENHPITVVGDAQISTIESISGNSSLVMDGTGDYLSIPYHSSLDFNGVEFTIEGWFYDESVSGNHVLVDFGGSNAAVVGWGIYVDSTNRSLNVIDTAGATLVLASDNNSVPANEWFHFACSRVAGVVSLYINGNFTVGTTYNLPVTDPTGVRVGINRVGVDACNGYFDEIRFTNGSPRYTSNKYFMLEDTPLVSQTIDYSINTELFIPFDAANTSTTFIDFSQANRTITPVGDIQISTAQQKFGGSSGFFDGTGDYLTIPHDVIFGNINSPFTIEGWFYVPTSHKSINMLYSKTTSPISSNGGWIFFLTSGAPRLFSYNTANTEFVALLSSVTIPVDEWVHIGFGYDGTTWRIWVNGIVTASTTSSLGTYAPAVDLFRIGNDPADSARDFNGYMDNVEMVFGVTKYTSNFIPNGAILDLNAANVELYLEFDGANGVTVFNDSSQAARTVTPTGDTQLSNVEIQDGVSSGLFDGTGDFLTVPHSVDLNNISAPFTIEAWLYVPGSHKSAVGIISKRQPSAPQLGYLFAMINSGQPYFLAFNSINGTYFQIITTVTTPLDEWFHLEIGFDGTTYRIFLNGIVIGSETSVVGVYQGSLENLVIGFDQGVSGRDFDGYIDGLRMTFGSTRHAAEFAPTRKFIDPDWFYTQLLMNFSNADTSVEFLDNSIAERALSVGGDIQISTAQQKFGGSSGFFDGTGDYLTIPHDAILDDITIPFTFDCWVYVPTSHKAAGAHILNKRGAGAATSYAFGLIGTTGEVFFIAWNNVVGIYVSITTSGAVPLDAWTHLEVGFDGTTYRAWINGNIDASSSATTGTYLGNSDPIQLGRDFTTAGREFNGYIDDIRIVFGASRHGSSFTPPTRQAGKYLSSLIGARLNGRLRVELESVRIDSLGNYISKEKYNHQVFRAGYGFSYGYSYGDAVIDDGSTRGNIELNDYIPMGFNGTLMYGKVKTPEGSSYKGQLITSGDSGLNWTVNSQPIGIDPTVVVYDQDLDNFSALGGTGVNWVSYTTNVASVWDAEHLTTHPLSFIDAPVEFGNLVYDAAAERMVIVGQFGVIYTRTQATSWEELSPNDLQSAGDIIDFVITPSGSAFYALVRNVATGYLQIWKSFNAISWGKTYEFTGLNQTLTGLRYENNSVFAFGTQISGGKVRPFVVISADTGLTFTEVVITVNPANPLDVVVTDIAFFNSNYVLFGNNIEGYSTDLISWTLTEPTEEQTLTNPAYNGTALMGARYVGNIFSLRRTTDGQSWSTITY